MATSLIDPVFFTMDKDLIHVGNPPIPGVEPRFSPGDWVCLDRDNYQVQLAIETEWPLPFHERHLQNFSAGKILALSYVPGEIWYQVDLMNEMSEVDPWLPESWLYLADGQGIGHGLTHIVEFVSSQLPIASQISVAGKTFNFKLVP